MFLLPSLIFWGVIIFVILKIKKKKEKLAEQEDKNRRKIFSEYVEAILKEASSSQSDVLFKTLYDSWMKKAISKEKDEVLKSGELSVLKEEYTKAFNELKFLVEDNTVFYTSKEQWDELNILERNKKVSDDIIKTIVPLKRFVNIHKKLKIDLFNEYLSDEIMMRYWFLWQNVYIDEGENDERTLKAHKSCAMQVKAMFDIFVDMEWDEICDNYPKYRTQENRNIFKKMAYNDTEVYNQFAEVFIGTLRDISLKDGYMQLYNELYYFFKDLEESIEKPEWLSHLSFLGNLGMYSSIGLSHLEKIDDSDILKIREFYKTGNLKGKLYQHMLD